MFVAHILGAGTVLAVTARLVPFPFFRSLNPTLGCLALLLSGCSSTLIGAGQCQQTIEPAPPPAPITQVVWSALSDGSAISWWQLALAGHDARLELAQQNGIVTGTLANDDGSVDPVDNITWDDAGGTLQFRDAGNGYWRWVRARSVGGVLAGRASYATDAGDPPGDVTSFSDHVTGWNEQTFSQDIVPRTFFFVTGGVHSRVRIDRAAGGAFVARYKQIATDSAASAAEQIELDGTVQSWDGKTLSATFLDGEGHKRTIAGGVDGGTFSGTFDAGDGSAAVSFTGRRGELLGFGLVSRARADHLAWQTRTRQQLEHLMMADNPKPLTVSVQRQPVTITPTSSGFAAARDDNPSQHPIDYLVDELQLAYTLPNPYGAVPITRAVHGFVTTPNTEAPPCGRPVVIALNGHDGSARGTLNPADPAYWYADAWARRGYVVVTIDIGHRPLADRATLYGDYVEGDAPAAGNGVHPSIAAAGLDSDWEEDGERTWDVERAIDFAATLADTNMSRVVVTGLSMGGEVTTFAGALDGRVTIAIPAGFVPDLSVMAWNGNHPCWQWQHGSSLDYFDAGDLHALIAPRPLVVQSGTVDTLFSRLTPPFIDGKEVTRRSRSFYADEPDNFTFYLHDDGHVYRFGDVLADDTAAPPEGLLQPVVVAPLAASDLTWAADPSRQATGRTLVQQVRASYRPPHAPGTPTPAPVAASNER